MVLGAKPVWRPNSRYRSTGSTKEKDSDTTVHVVNPSSTTRCVVATLTLSVRVKVTPGSDISAERSGAASTSSPPKSSYGYHIVPLALAWDLGARFWTDELRTRFANDPANLLAVQGKANQDKGDGQPSVWMPPNRAFWCQYSVQFSEVLRGYGLPIDQPSAVVLRDAAATCPTG
jgi:hypothetical protein